MLDFETILVLLTFISGLLALLDKVFFAPKRLAKVVALKQQKEEALVMDMHKAEKVPLVFEYSRSLFPVFLIVLLLRSFVFEPFRIPSGSLKPTLQIGDFLLVNKFTYGLRLPVLHNKFLKIGEPQRGDIVVFRWPPNPHIDYIKRIIGVPGDKVSYINKQLTINGKPVPQTFVKDATDSDPGKSPWPVVEKSENLLGVKHEIYQRPNVPAYDFNDIVVPEGYYFAMGDNRDDSADSRYWGFVPEKNIVGKASYIWFSWNSDDTSVRWRRIGQSIH